MDAGDGAGRKGADHGDLVGRGLLDFLAGLIDRDKRPAETRNCRQVGELAEHVVEGVEAVAHCDGEHVGSVGVVEHVGVGLDHSVTRDRQPHHRRRQDFTDVAVAEQVAEELDGRSLAALKPDDGVHALLGCQHGHGLRVVKVASERPLAIHGLPSGQRGRDKLAMVGHFDRDRDHIDVLLGNQLLVIGERRAHPERIACCASGLWARCADGADVVVRESSQRRDVRGGGPAPICADTDDPDAELR